MLRVERSLGKYRGKYSEVRVTKREFSYDYRNTVICITCITVERCTQ